MDVFNIVKLSFPSLEWKSNQKKKLKNKNKNGGHELCNKFVRKRIFRTPICPMLLKYNNIELRQHYCDIIYSLFFRHDVGLHVNKKCFGQFFSPNKKYKIYFQVYLIVVFHLFCEHFQTACYWQCPIWSPHAFFVVVVSISCHPACQYEMFLASFIPKKKYKILSSLSYCCFPILFHAHFQNACLLSMTIWSPQTSDHCDKTIVSCKYKFDK